MLASGWGNLKIPISVENTSQEVETKDLRISEYQEYIYLQAFLSDQANETLTLPQIRQKIDRLPPAERAKATKAALELYGESLYQDEPPEE